MGIGDWGLAQSPIPNPQSPIPNPQIWYLFKLYNFYKILKFKSVELKFKWKKMIMNKIS